MEQRPPLDFDLLTAYLTGDCSAEQRTAVEQWCAEHPSHEQMLRKLSRMWSAVRHQTDQHVDVSAMVRAVRVSVAHSAADHTERASAQTSVRTRAIRETLPPRLGNRRYPWGASVPWHGLRLVAGISAVALLMLGITTWRIGSSTQPSVTNYATRVGQRTTLTLQDGSTVTLAPQTHLRVSGRTLQLRGEAYFVVRDAAGSPFTVHTGAVTTRVLGTAFAVRRYAGDETTQVAVVSGKVAIGRQGSAVPVSAGAVVRATDSVTTVTSSQDIHAYTDWTQGRLVFKDTPIPVVLKTVGRWYGYEFRLADSALVTQDLSVIFKTSDPQEMLNALRVGLDVTMTFDGNVVVLTPRRTSTHTPRMGVPSRVDSYKPSLEMGR